MILIPRWQGQSAGHGDKPATLATGSWELHEELKTISINLPPIVLEDVELYDG